MNTWFQAAVDAGAIIEQASVPVHSDDTEDSLTLRIKEQEHVIFPKALKLLAAEKVALDLQTGKVIWNWWEFLLLLYYQTASIIVISSKLID